MYDLSGRRIRERVVQAGVTYQDNHLAYDAQGNLRDIADARAHITIDYDKVGNRTHITTYVNYQGTSGEASSTTDRYFQYDAMNRQKVVDAVDAAGNLGQQGHRLEYDLNGNRTSDTYWGYKVVTTGGEPVFAGYNEDGTAIYISTSYNYTSKEGYSTEEYAYDNLNRLRSVVKDQTQIDLRLYDAADRVVRSGSPGNLPPKYAEIINAGLAPDQTNGKEMRINRYDGNGRLMHQRTFKSDWGTSSSPLKSDISWDANETLVDGTTAKAADGYDAAGNARSYVVKSHEGGGVSEYVNAFARFEGYQASAIAGSSSKQSPGTTTQQFDANGFLVGVTDSGQPANNRTFVNDSAGRALFVNQGGKVQRQLIVNGEVLGIYGAAEDQTNTSNNPTFANLAEFNFGYAKVSSSYPLPSPGAYTVRTGDTLQAIAQGAYGDSSLWYRIAEANGLASNTDLKVGQTLNIPNRVSGVSNNSTTFKPYDPSKIEGDKTPTLVTPEKKGGCGGVGKILMVIVAIVVTIYTAGALSGATGGFMSTMSAGVGVMTGTAGAIGAGSVGAALGGAAGTLAVAAATGSVASQLVGLATGTIEKFDWKGVALSAISGGVSAGTAGMFGATAGGIMAQTAVANALTQGISVAVGLQKKFDWRGVAASAVGAGVGQAVGDALGTNSPAFKTARFGEQFGKRLVTSLVAGAATAIAHGGKVAIQQVATDAFGNALGQGILNAVVPQDNAQENFRRGEILQQNEQARMDGQQADIHRTGGDFTRTDRIAYNKYVNDQQGIAQSDTIQAQRLYEHSSKRINGLDLPSDYVFPETPVNDAALGEKRLHEGMSDRAGNPSQMARESTTERHERVEALGLPIDPRDGMRAGPTVDRAARQRAEYLGAARSVVGEYQRELDWRAGASGRLEAPPIDPEDLLFLGIGVLKGGGRLIGEAFIKSADRLTAGTLVKNALVGDSRALKSALLEAGVKIPDGFVPHHLIPGSMVKGDYAELFQIAAKNGYSINGAANGLPLPSALADAVRSGDPLHRGGHLRDYFDDVGRELESLNAAFKSGDLPSSMVPAALDEVSLILKARLISREVFLTRKDPMFERFRK